MLKKFSREHLGTLLTLILAEKTNCHAYCGLCAAIFIIFMLTQKR